MASPFFKILLLDDNNKQDITKKFDNRLISMTFVDNNGFQADTITLVIDDSDQKVNLPKKGVKLEITLGWSANNKRTTMDNQEEVIFEANIKNVFTITQVTHSGTPDIITIQGTSANLSGEIISVNREESYDSITLGNLIATIAKRNNLTYRYDKEIGSKYIPHIDQTRESDSSFLTRLIDEYGGGITVKNDILIVFNKGLGITVNGKTIPPAKIKRESGNSHSYTISNRNQYAGVQTFWYNYKNPTKEPQKIIYKEQLDKSSVYYEGSKDKIKVLRSIFANKESAIEAAKSEMKKIQRGTAFFKLKLALGRPDLFTEMPVEVTGFKPEINSTQWTITKCTHSLSKQSGFTTEVELEIKPQEQSYENILPTKKPKGTVK